MQKLFSVHLKIQHKNHSGMTLEKKCYVENMKKNTFYPFVPVSHFILFCAHWLESWTYSTWVPQDLTSSSVICYLKQRCRDWNLSPSSGEHLFSWAQWAGVYLRAEAEYNFWNNVLNKNRTMDNVQEVNHCISITVIPMLTPEMCSVKRVNFK
jgi:hypothetical protein